jgi:hypothetical protein
MRGPRAEFIELSTGAHLAKLEFPRVLSLTSGRNVYMGGVSRAAFTAQGDRIVLASFRPALPELQD